MSRIRTNLITNRMANGAPTVSHGLVVAGVTTVTGSINNLNLTGITTISTLDLNGDLDVDGHLNADNVSIAGVVTATSYRGDGSQLTGIVAGLSTISGVVNVVNDLDVDGHTNLDNVSIAGVTTFTGNANFGSNGSITSAANFTLSSNKLRVTGSDTVGIECQRAGNATIQCTDTTNSTDLQLRANSEGGLVRTATNYPLILGAFQKEKLRIDGGSYARIGINTTTFDTAGSQIKIEGRGTGTTSPAYLQIKGVGTGVLHSYVDLIATSENNAGSAYRGLGVIMLDEPTNVEWFSGRPYAGSDEYIIGRKASPSYRTQSGEKANALFKVGSDGKLYKSGTHFYPLVNYSTYATFSAVSVSSSSYTDLRTILSSYTPKKAGNIIVIHHQSQCWQGNDANSNGDAMWKIQKQEGGGSWTDVIANERIMGNMDGRNYTGGSGLSRHHRTVHLMGSFECAGTSINLKTQGKVDFTGVGLQWYHHSQNILQVWEYEKG